MWPWSEVGAVQWGAGSVPLPPVHGIAGGWLRAELYSLHDPQVSRVPHIVPLVSWLDIATADSQTNSWASRLGHNLWPPADGASSRAGPDRMGEPKVTRLPSCHLPAKASPAGVKLIRRVCGESGASSLRAPFPAAAWFCYTDLCFLRPPAHSNLMALASTVK